MMKCLWTGTLAALLVFGSATAWSSAQAPRPRVFRGDRVRVTGQTLAADTGVVVAPDVVQRRVVAPRRVPGGLIETVARRVNPFALENQTRSISFRPSYYDEQPVPTGQRRVFRPRVLRPRTGLFGFGGHRGCAHCDR